ncbi:MAG TPA: hypothetical protein VFM55_26290 [Micromonosporaceae bacterium]|nr:hypothetical protein [Micromonosporaceae bacterium]
MSDTLDPDVAGRPRGSARGARDPVAAAVRQHDPGEALMSPQLEVAEHGPDRQGSAR